MNFLFDNPLANMPGSVFLVLYAAMVLLSAVVFYLVKSNFDWTAKQPALLIPSNPDPYEIAYLRGGENEFTRALIFTLTQKGFLKITNDVKKSYIVLAETQPNWTTLSPMERSILGWFQTTRETNEVFGNSDLTENLKPYSMTFEQKVNQNHLLTPPDVKTRTRLFSILAFCLVGALGGYKLLLALLNGRSNILALIIMTVIAFIIFMFLGKTKRISKRGERYLQSLQTTFNRLRYNQTPSSYISVPNSMNPTLLAVGLFGTGILAGTVYSEYEQAFHRANASSGSGCGSACGSSCSSSDNGGGDVGSSCGGCGGGD